LSKKALQTTFDKSSFGEDTEEESSLSSTSDKETSNLVNMCFMALSSMNVSSSNLNLNYKSQFDDELNIDYGSFIKEYNKLVSKNIKTKE
jgi:hypothetical protein